MSKTRKNLSLDEHIAARLENEVENQSRVVNELLKSYLKKDVDDEVSLKQKKKKLKQKLEELEREKEEQIEKYNKKISSTKAELRSIKEKLEEQKKQWITVETDCGIRISSNYVDDKWTDKKKTREAVAMEQPVSDVTGNKLEEGTPIVVDTERGLIWEDSEHIANPNKNVNDHKRAVLTEVKV